MFTSDQNYKSFLLFQVEMAAMQALVLQLAFRVASLFYGINRGEIWIVRPVHNIFKVMCY